MGKAYESEFEEILMQYLSGHISAVEAMRHIVALYSIRKLTVWK